MRRPRPSAPPDPDPSPRDSQHRKHRVLSHGLPSVTQSITDAIVLKQGDVFFIAGPDGQVPASRTSGLGLYYHDCRFLHTYELQLNGTAPVPLGVTVAEGDRGSVQLTNAETDDANGNGMPRDTLDLEWGRTLDGDALTLTDVITIRNWGHQPIDVTLSLTLDAGFEDVFDVRGLLHEQLGRAEPPAWRSGALRFVYHGRDKLTRSLTVRPPADFAPTDGTTLAGSVRLAPREERQVTVSLEVSELAHGPDVASLDRPPRRPRSESSRSHPESHGTIITCDSPLLDTVLARSLADLRLLRSSLRGRTYIAAGIPWFATLFGRDSLIAALQLLPFDPAVARDTLRLLAAYQADAVDEWRDAAPGKILHELRVGEMAKTGAIPHSPYYGTVDATPLFLIVLGRYVAWTGDLDLFAELEDNVRRALEWIDHYGDREGDGYVEYRSASEHGLINQGWKDSGDAIVDEQGAIATPPIALVEVQAYVYAAKLETAALFERRGDPDTAGRLRQEAAALRERFERDFWIDELDCYAMALEARKQPLRVVSSNAGQVLWTGIADQDRAGRVAARLLADDMFSGWGVRTLSEQSKGYNPIGYHLGTVWPHDNAFFGAGLVRYGLAAEARRIFDGICDAAAQFEHQRLPELWTGFSRQRYGTPIRYPVACHPQAWAAGALPYLLTHLLGLDPQALDRRLRVVRPVLPSLARRLELRLRVGRSVAALRFTPTGQGDETAVEITKVQGDLDVQVEA